MKKKIKLSNPFYPGILVKNTRSGNLGVLISKDTFHDQYWKVLSSVGNVNWFEHNFKRV
tara:strand:+ start:8 stop:184 length:177 start_codon:yes stop_codon:yes gene_type:complete